MQSIRSLITAHPIITGISLALRTLLILFMFISCPGFSHAQEEIFYFLTDHLGSVDVVLDENANVVERRDNLPYGSSRSLFFTGVPHGNYTVETRSFTGKQLDTQTGLHYYGARYYDSEIGRFMSMDPVTLGHGSKDFKSLLSNPQSLNSYSYVLNNSLRYVDPTGMYEKDVHYDLTYYLGLISGLPEIQSKIVAFRDQYMDENPATKPDIRNLLSGVVNELHFVTRDQALGMIGDSTKAESVDALGRAMHSFQDTYSHSGLTPAQHIGLSGTLRSPDKTYTSPAYIAKANTMARATFFQLRKFNLAVNGSGGLSRDAYISQSKEIWNNFKQEINAYLSLENKEGSKIETLSRISEQD